MIRDLTPIEQLELWVKYIKDNPDDRAKVSMGLRNIRQVINGWLQAGRLPPTANPDYNKLLSEFLATGRSRSGTRDDILSGCLFINEGRIYFSLSWWQSWLKMNHRLEPPNRQLTNIIRLRGGDKLFFNFKRTGYDDKNEGRNMWWVPNT